MSVSDPLLKDLKGCILDIVKSEEEVVRDTHPTLEFLCSTLEAIFRKGMNCSQSSPFGITRKDYWSWIEYILNSTTLFDTGFKLSLNKLLDSPRVTRVQGKGRLFIRHALSSGCLHVPVEEMVRKKYFDKMYNEESILGNEILGEIFLSLVFQISQIKFDLQMENSAFLDESWMLPDFRKYELSPCLDMGIYLGHVKGWAVVLRVDDGSVAAEDNKIESGDVIDEVFGVCIRGWRKGKITSLFKQHKGLPISLKVIKGRYKNGQIYPGVVPLLRRLQINVEECRRELPPSESSFSDPEEQPSSPHLRISGHYVNFLGSVDVGGLGDVSMIDNAVAIVLKSKHTPIPVAMVTGEIGVQTIVRASRKLLFSHSYTEISSCGRRNDNSLLYAYIAGNTSCNLSSQFTCYVFQAGTEELSKEILLTLADGFHRTHWAV